MKEIDWKEAVTHASPYPYILLTSVDKGGKPNAMGLGWWSFTSMNPPLILVSVGKSRFTLDNIRATKEFAVCFPGEGIAKGAWHCGVASGRDTDKLKDAGLKTIPGKAVKAPIIEGSSTAIECRVVDEFETGDHIVFVGEMLAYHGDPEKAMHIYSVFYSTLVSMDTKGNRNFALDFK
ncbi:MAG: flavin reductase family protein [Deltaproteobacteria bacterium]|uniref:Flavin reductase family protein n=1 Tax=Candidatus Zymogenus saltonus TaxID=2844893 RepID=A0A9D8KD93_9DELT|nr:flavin reductase family protein [Candidatus Zymogenus saltonus]